MRRQPQTGLTFYDQYADTFAPLQCVVGSRFEGTCHSASLDIVDLMVKLVTPTFYLSRSEAN